MYLRSKFICYRSLYVFQVHLLSQFVSLQARILSKFISDKMHLLLKLICHQRHLQLISSNIKAHITQYSLQSLSCYQISSTLICIQRPSTIKVIPNQSSSVIKDPILSKLIYTQVNLLSIFILSPIICYRDPSTITVCSPSQFIY